MTKTTEYVLMAATAFAIGFTLPIIYAYAA